MTTYIKKKERKKKKRFIEIAASEESYTGPRRSSLVMKRG